MYDKEKILDAIWQDPARGTGLSWTFRGNSWTCRQRPDGTDGGRADKMTLRRHNGGIWAHYNGASFPQSQDVIDLCKYLYSTNDFLEVLERLADTYGIVPDRTGYDADRLAAVEKKRAEAPFLSAMEDYFKKALNDERGRETRQYLEERGLAPSGRMGAVSEEIINDMVSDLHASTQFKGVSIVEIRKKIESYFTIGKENPYRINADNYRLALPYYNGGRCVGFCFRYTGTEQQKMKYIYTQGMAKGGYCDNLDHSQPVLLVEGLLDAERCKQAGYCNVMALGGTTPTDSEDPQRSQIKTLQRYGAKQLVYIPDYEREKIKDADGNVKGFGAVKTAATQNTIRAILPYLDGNPDGRGFISLKIADLANKDGNKDADDYIRAYGPDNFGYVVANAEPWFLWQLRTSAERLDGELLADAAVKVYRSIKNPITREDLKNRLTAGGCQYLDKLRTLGFNAAALTQIDRTGAASTYREKMLSASAELSEAVKNHAPAEELAEIVRKLAKVQRNDNQNGFASQITTTREELEQQIARRSDYIETPWPLYDDRLDKRTDRVNYEQVRRISFAPAAVSILCAPTNHGKTLFLMQTAIKLAQTGNKRNLYISTEEDLPQLYIRSLAAFIGKKWGNVKGPRFELRNNIRKKDLPLELFPDNQERSTDIEAETARYWRDIAPKLKFIYDNGADIDSLKENVTAIVEEWRAEGIEPGAIIIDYLQMIHKTGKAYSRTEEIKDVCDSLNDLAKTTGLSVILGAQLNREAVKNENRLDGVDSTNLGESSGIERIANDIYLLWQTDKIKLEHYPENKRKQRIRRCIDENGELRENRLYIENIKARDYRTGGYCLLPYNGAAGCITDESEH